MPDFFGQFEEIVRVVPVRPVAEEEGSNLGQHPFEVRNIHRDLPKRARALFDNGFFAESIFEAFKFVEKEVKRASGLKITGFPLMMKAFDEGQPVLQLNDLSDETELDEQRGFRHMFAGAQSALRNPRGHGTDLVDTPDVCLDYLSVASVLLRRLDSAGLREA